MITKKSSMNRGFYKGYETRSLSHQDCRELALLITMRMALRELNDANTRVVFS
jgi:hypothetical protein